MNNLKFVFKKRFILLFSLLLMVGLYCFAAKENPKISVITDNAPGKPVLHALNKLTNALAAKNIPFEKVASLEKAQGETIIVAGISEGKGIAAQMLKAGNHAVPQTAEALTVWKTKWQKKPVWVVGGFDDTGLMYCLLDFASQIGWSTNLQQPFGEVREITEKPDVSKRAISLYTMNRAYWESRFYDEKYWERYLDMLARNRFNSMVLIFGYENGGFLAPCYPYFFDTEGFPGVKMVGLAPAEQKRNLDALNRLISMAHERGIKFSVAIWDHIYRGGVQGGGIEGAVNVSDKPVEGLVWGVDGDNLVPYTKAALAKFIQLTQGLDGLEFRMHEESGVKDGEQGSFWLDVFRLIKKTAPDLNLVLRAKGMQETVIQSALDVGIKFSIETKYWMEQMGMPFHPTHINRQNQFDRRQGYANMLRYPQQYKMYWRLWNGGTTRILLWGDPEYARRFAESTHLYDGDAYEVNEPLATKMEAQPHDAKPFNLLNQPYRYYDFEFERYWHFFQVFGRMGYNPRTSPEVWQREFNQRFGEKAAPLIETALHTASWILPRIVASVYHYGSSFPTTRGWAEKQRLEDLPVYADGEGSDIQQFASFDEEARLLIEGGETAKLLPSATSRWFEQTSGELNMLIAKAENAIGNNRNKEFISTITDLKILSNLALYHARRIPAAVSYRLFERTKDSSAFDAAIAYERNAIEAWQQIVDAADDIYASDLMMGVRKVTRDNEKHEWVKELSGHWKDELVLLEKGLTTLEQKRKEYKSVGMVKPAPHYKLAASADNTELFQVSLLPVTSAPVAKSIAIIVQVNATAGIKWVHLRYRSVNQEEDYKTMEMLPAVEKNAFQAVVPAAQINPQYDFMYFIEVMDKKGRGKIYPDLNKETPYVFVKLVYF
jgi:hypothetical protein